MYAGKSLLILDEGTANIDRETAFDIEKRLLENKKITLITVSHHVEEETSEKTSFIGADYVMRDYKVKNIYMTKFKSNRNEYKEMIAAIKKYDVIRTNVKVGMKIDLGGIKATVLHMTNSGTSANDSRIVL